MQQRFHDSNTLGNIVGESFADRPNHAELHPRTVGHRAAVGDRQRLNGVQQLAGIVETKTVCERPGEVRLQLDAGRVQICRQIADPAHHRLDIALFRQRLHAGFRVSGPRFPGGQRMANRLGPQLLSGKPVAGLFMQYADIHLRTVLQTIQQRFAHQRVVAEPEPVRIQGREKQIVPDYPRQHRLSVAFPGHGIAQRRMQAVEYCGSQKKVQHPGGQWRKDHLFQVAREGAGSGIQLAVGRATMGAAAC